MTDAWAMANNFEIAYTSSGCFWSTASPRSSPRYNTSYLTAATHASDKSRQT
jgi:hypothetical protein